MMYPLVLDLADDGFPVAVTCRVLGFSTQAFNKWRRNPVSQRDWDEAHVINAAIDIHDDDPAFGYRFISDELADAGFEVSERRVWRLCGSWPSTRTARANGSTAATIGARVAGNPVERTSGCTVPPC